MLYYTFPRINQIEEDIFINLSRNFKSQNWDKSREFLKLISRSQMPIKTAESR